MNCIFLKGNVGQDPKITNFDDGGKVAQFTLATTERGRKLDDGREIPDETTWHNIVVRRKGLAGVCEQYVKKGTPLLIQGALKRRKYTDSNGNERESFEIHVSNLELLGGNNRDSAPAPAPDYMPGHYNGPDMPENI